LRRAHRGAVQDGRKWRLAKILAIVHVQIPLLQPLVPKVEILRLILLAELVEAGARTLASDNAGLGIPVLQDLLLPEIPQGAGMALILAVDGIELLHGVLLREGWGRREDHQAKTEQGRQNRLGVLQTSWHSGFS
jgi:hypothetical protein